MELPGETNKKTALGHLVGKAETRVRIPRTQLTLPWTFSPSSRSTDGWIGKCWDEKADVSGRDQPVPRQTLGVSRGWRKFPGLSWVGDQRWRQMEKDLDKGGHFPAEHWPCPLWARPGLVFASAFGR